MSAARIVIMFQFTAIDVFGVLWSEELPFLQAGKLSCKYVTVLWHSNNTK
jgi:hypothetical protein